MNVNKMTEQAAETVESLKNKTEGWTDKVKDTARDTGAAADLYAHEYVWTTLALLTVAAGAIGFLLGRSSKR